MDVVVSSVTLLLPTLRSPHVTTSACAGLAVQALWRPRRSLQRPSRTPFNLRVTLIASLLLDVPPWSPAPLRHQPAAPGRIPTRAPGFLYSGCRRSPGLDHTALPHVRSGGSSAKGLSEPQERRMSLADQRPRVGSDFGRRPGLSRGRCAPILGGRWPRRRCFPRASVRFRGFLHVDCRVASA